MRPQSHSSSGSRTAGQVSPLDVGYLRASAVLWKIARDVQVQTVQTTDRRQKFQASHSGRRGNPEPFQKNNSATHNRTGHQKDCISGSLVASAGSRLQASQKFLAKSVHPQTFTEAFFRAFGQVEADFDLSHHSGRSQGSTAAEQGMPQVRLGRSRHSLQAASEDQNLQAERSANVLCRHRSALSFLRYERSSTKSAVRATALEMVSRSLL